MNVRAARARARARTREPIGASAMVGMDDPEKMQQPALDLDWPPHPAHPEPLLPAPATSAVELVKSGGPPLRVPAAPLSVPSLSDDELVQPIVLLEEDVRQRLFAPSFRERLAATAQLEPWHVNSDAEFGTVLHACASLGRSWAKENNVQVASTGLRFLHVQLRVFLDYRCASPDRSNTRGKEQQHWMPAIPPAAESTRALASICGFAATRLSERKSSIVASNILHAAADLHSLRWVLAAAIDPLAAAAVVSPAPAAAAMVWLSAALRRWEPTTDGAEFQHSQVPQAAIACCAAALRSPAVNTRAAALSALVALNHHCPVLEAIAAPEHGCTQSIVATVRAELSKHPPPRVVFRRQPRDCTGREVPWGKAPPREVWYPSATALGVGSEAPLEFSSSFECGNLHQAAMVDRREYELWLEPDTHVTTHRLHTQWFFFRVRRMVRTSLWSIVVLVAVCDVVTS